MPHTCPNSHLRSFAVIATTALALAATGCKPTEFNQVYSDTQAKHVDRTRVAAARNCWPAIEHEGFSKSVTEHYLADPLHFRSTFATYAVYSDADLIKFVSQPISNAPVPGDYNFVKAQTPVLTLSQAINGANSAPDPGTVPHDFCIVHAGTPVGFK
jgi:hypothetical protein